MSAARHGGRAAARWALLVGALAGCVARDAGFGEVRQTVRARTGQDVRWDPDRAERGATLPEVRAMLARPLTADGAVQVALLNNPDLRASFEDLGVARAGLVAAGLLPNPRLRGEYRFHVDRQGAAPDAPGIEFEAGIDLVALLLLPTRRGAARAELEAARLRVTGRTLDVAYETRTAFYRYQAAEQTVELRRTVLQATAAAFEAARLLREAGNLPALDVLQEQALYEESRLALATAETDARLARERVNGLLGVWGGDVAWRAEGRLADPPAGELDVAQAERRAVERSLDLAALRWQIEATGQRLGVARTAGLLPRLEGGVAVVREGSELTVGPGVSLTLPVFDQGQGEVGRRLAELRRARSAYVAQAVRLRASVRATRARLELARQRVEWYRATLLPLRAQIVEQSQLQYNAMQLGVFQLLQARRAQIDAGRAYIAALRDYWIARAAMAQLLAGRTLDPPGDAGDAQPREDDGPGTMPDQGAH